VLVRKLPEFRYRPDPRFRDWLWTVLVNKFREQRRRLTVAAVADDGALATLAATAFQKRPHGQCIVSCTGAPSAGH
jgi:hypothetical protein